MNLPNKLTLFRIVLIPFFVVVILTNCFADASKWVALVIFIGASFTDMLDGNIARKYHLVTNFGKFMDPLADKLLVCSAMICLVELAILPAWVVIIIIAREFAISGFRLVASDNGVVIAAGKLGKWKTVFQMLMVCLCIADISQIAILTVIVIYVTIILTVVSLVDYVVKNIGVMKDFK